MTAAKKAASATKKTTKATQEVAPKEAKVAKKPAVQEKTEVKAAPKAKTEKKTLKSMVSQGGAPVAHGVGRRKAAVARVWVRRGGTGSLTVNNRTVAEYFDTEIARKAAQLPFTIVPAVAERYNYDVNVVGGGQHGQADAIKLAISRALVEADDSTRTALKAEGLLTVDARVVERKKYGQKKARRRFQFVKR